jgi:hypothetical protein
MRTRPTAAAHTKTPAVPAAATTLLFEAALAQGRRFTLDNEGEARLTLAVPEQFARLLSEQIHRLRDRSFIVRIEGAR